MMTIRFLLLLLLTSNMAWGHAWADVRTEPDIARWDLDGTWIGKDVRYFEDETGTMSRDEVFTKWSELPLKSGGKEVLNLGFTPHPLWFRFSFENSGQESRFIIVEHPYPSDSLHIFPVLAGQSQEPIILGYKERETTALRYRNPAVRLEIPPGRHMLDFRLQHTGAVKFSVKLWDDAAFSSMKWKEEWLLGIILGTTLIMVFYNIFMFLMMQTRDYLSYVGFLLSSLFWLTFYSGIGRLAPEPWKMLFAHGWIACMFLMLLFLVLFTVQFLRLNQRLPRTARVMQVLAVICLGGTALSLFAPLPGFYLSQLLLQPSLLYCLAVAGISAWKGYRPAVFYLVSFLGVITGAFMEGLVAQDMLDAHYGFWPFLSSYALQTVLLSLAVGDQIHINQTNARQRIEKLNEQLQHHIKHINEIVDEKTRDIRSIMKTIRQGILSIHGPDYQIHPDYSAHLEVIFGKSVLRSADAFDFLFERSDLGQDAIRQVKAVVEVSLGSDAFNFEANTGRLPKEMRLGQIDEKQKILELDWYPILDAEEKVEKILVTARDVTEIRKLREQSDQQRIHLEAMSEILAVEPDRFRMKFRILLDMNQSCQKTRLALEQLDAAGLKSLFIHCHTMKGMARSLGLKRLCDSLHKVEDAIAVALEAGGSAHPAKLEPSLASLQTIFHDYETLGHRLWGQRFQQDRSAVSLEVIWKALKSGNMKDLERLCLMPAADLLATPGRRSGGGGTGGGQTYTPMEGG